MMPNAPPILRAQNRRNRFDLFGGPASVDDEGCAGDEGSLIRGKIEGRCGNFLWESHSPERLARVQRLAHGVFLTGEAAPEIALDERGAHRAGTDCVAANALADEVDGDTA